MTISEKINIYNNSISTIAKKNGIPDKDLLVKFLIDSNQFSENSLMNERFMVARIEILAREIKNNRNHLGRKYYHSPIKSLQKEKCYIKKLDWRLAKEILVNYHHIGSYRKNSVHLGLYYIVEPNVKKLMGIATFSKYDFFLRPYSIFSNFNSNEVFNLSRLYIFDWAPYNTASCFISKSTDYLREYYPGIQCLITCINPNTGHQGKTFNACNWIETGQFTGAPYLYLDKKPITIRRLFENFGTLELSKLKKQLKERLIISKSKVLPQKIYMYIINKKTRSNFFSSRIDKIYYFDDYYFTPEYGLTDNNIDNAITYNEARQKIQNIGINVIAGYLEKDNSYLYSSIIIKNGRLFLNIKKRIQDTPKLYENQEEYQLKVVNIPTFSKTVITYGDQVGSKNIQFERYIKSGKIDTIIILSYLGEDANQLLDNVIKRTKSTNIKTIILYDYFHGFNFVKL
ncbi:MAG: hypothetical protein Q7K55_05240 [Candidatus Levybacteria bacterium]|nr:hypothetical protein [Candidatus Levybacteria bacterium]